MWTWAFDQEPWARVRDAAMELDALGYGTVWFGEATGRDAVSQSALLLAATDRLAVAPGVANIYRHEPATLAQAQRTLTEAFPGRFLLGLGVGAQRFATGTRPWGPPLAAMRAFLDRMDAAPLTGPAPAEPPRRVLAAWGPKMLRLAGDRAWGAHPFFLPPEHTAHARTILGADALLAVHQTVVLHEDRRTAGEIARAAVGPWIEHLHLTPSRWRAVGDLLGFDESDLAGGGSDRLVDALVVSGDLDTVAKGLQAQFDAGADHVCIGIATADPVPSLALPQLRELAAIL